MGERFRSCLVGSTSEPLITFDEMMEKHIKEGAVESVRTNDYAACSRCGAEDECPDYISNTSQSVSCWPKFVVPFHEDCMIKKVFVDGWFDTRTM